MNLPVGKGMFIWKIPYCEGGDGEKIAAAALAAGFSHVLIKIANGTANFNVDTQTGVDWAVRILPALRQAGLSVWGWHYVYGFSPETEAALAIKRCQALGLDGYVIDAEEEYKGTGAAAARKYCNALRKGLSVPIALSSYRFPTLHPQFPWDPFLSNVDLAMPQVYWMKGTNSAEQLSRSYREYMNLRSALPYIPTGAAFHQDGWTARPTEITAFSDQARALSLPAINFWEWNQARVYDLWDALAHLDWGSPQPEPPPIEAGARVLRMRVAAGQLNVRSGPGVNYPDVGDLCQGDIVDVLDVEGGRDVWVKIQASPERWACVRLYPWLDRYLTPVLTEVN